MAEFNTKVTPEIERLTQECKDHSSIDLSLYGKYDVKRAFVISMVKVYLPDSHRFPMYRQ